MQPPGTIAPPARLAPGEGARDLVSLAQAAFVVGHQAAGAYAIGLAGATGPTRGTGSIASSLAMAHRNAPFSPVSGPSC